VVGDGVMGWAIIKSSLIEELIHKSTEFLFKGYKFSLESS
jgi:hypothetical protein